MNANPTHYTPVITFHLSTMHERNQALQLTAPGTAALAVVRVVGAELESFFSRRFSRALIAGKPVHGNLSDDSGIIDDPLVMLAPDRTWADVSLHGGAWVVEATLELLKQDGFEIVSVDDEGASVIAFPGSNLSDCFMTMFGGTGVVPVVGAQHRKSIRAFGSITGEMPVPSDLKLFLIEREVLKALGMARTDLALTVLLNQVDAWKSIDKSDAKLIRSILEDRALEHLLHPPTVALIGIPNAGKSSLANQLFGQDRSIVSEHAGTTRDWVGEEANLDGLIVRLIDTPGVRESDDPIEREAILRSSPVVRQADLVIVVLDPTSDLDEQRARMNRSRDSWSNQVWIEVVNKSDLIPEQSQIGLSVSAQTGQGAGELVRRIRNQFGIENIDVKKPRVWNERTRALLNPAR